MLQCLAIKIYNLRCILNKKKEYFSWCNRIFILNTPLHGNLGDQAIVKAEYVFFQKYFPKNKVFEIPRKDFEPGIMKRVIRKNDLLVIHGGGYLGSLYQWKRRMHVFL